MACINIVSPVGSDGSSCYDRGARQGYTNNYSARENIYVGNPVFGGTPQGAFDWWMDSTTHRDNILHIEVTEAGVAYVFNPSSEYGGYYTTVFAKP